MEGSRWWRATALAVLCAVVMLANPTYASGQASAYVPLDDIAYTYIDALMARGQLRELSVLERPFTERAISAAIDSARTRMTAGTSTGYLDALYESIEKYSARPGMRDSLATQGFHARGSADVYLTGQTSGRRELMLADTTNGAKPGGAIRVVMTAGPIVGFVRTLIDSRLNADPEFAGRKDRTLAGRTEDGYFAGMWKYGELSFGRVGRNWGPPTQYGLMLGNYAYSYDHLYGLIGNDLIHFSTVIARLDDIVPLTGPQIDRYFSIHRLAVHVANWDLAASESYVYGGIARGFEPTLANPFNIYALSWRNEQQEGNLGLSGELAVRSQRFGTLAGQVFLDDVQVDRSCVPYCQQPASYALTVTAEGLPLLGDQRWFASYARVSNLAYRNKNPDENYEIFGVSLGMGYSDYDEVRAGLDLALLPRTPLRLYAAHRRQGEGTYNIPYPAPPDFATTPGIFSGVVMGVTRVGLSGGSRWSGIELNGDIGVNHDTNYQHVQGATHTGFEGRVRVAIEPKWGISL